MRQDRLRQYWPFAIVVFLVLLFFFRLAFTDLILARGDPHTYFYPYWAARDDALASGQLPLWTTELFMGAPLLANPQIGTLYPPNWLTVSLNAPDAIRVSILLHVTWATLGAYLLARRALSLPQIPALIAGILFGLGGFVGAHVEQINQLQALSWLPWLFLLLQMALERPRPYVPVLGMAWALQLLAGHPQIVFISGVGLTIWGLFHGFTHNPTVASAIGEQPWHTPQYWQSRLRPLRLLALAGTIAVILALPQLLPTQQLIAASNRGGGLNAHEATAFSLNPLRVGRGFLPSYDGQPFTEYIAYLGVTGLGLAVLGMWSDDRRKWAWVLLAGAGLFLAFGRHNPLYMQLAHWPGFNLFRVPARWLALFALGAAMLGGLGAQALLSNTGLPRRAGLRPAPALTITVVMGILAAGSLLSDRATEEFYGPHTPTAKTFFAWGLALAVFIGLYWQRQRLISVGKWRMRAGQVLPLLVIAELWLAADKLPYNDLVDPAVYNDARFTIRQMQVYGEDATPPGRLLSISAFDFHLSPREEAVLLSRWEDRGLRPRAIEHAFTAVKRQETVSANMPLAWGIPSLDGFGGGVLPTGYYTAFTSLLLPEGTPRTIDGRLREVLALDECRGACIPDDRWLDLTNAQYLLTDKHYDRVYEGIFYDTQFSFPVQPWTSYRLLDPPEFEANSLHILYRGDGLPRVYCRDADAAVIPFVPIEGEEPFIDGYWLARLVADTAIVPERIVLRLETDTEIDVRALTLVDTRTGDFVQLLPKGWRRIYSGDVKIYENLDVLPRAFVAHEAVTVPDTWHGMELALDLMRDSRFNPADVVVISSDARELIDFAIGRHPWFDPEPVVEIVEYTATRVVIEVEAGGPGYLVLTDAFYPEWRATVNGEAVEIYRADVMFRAVPIREEHSTVVFEYANRSFHLGLSVTVVFGLGNLMIGGLRRRRRHSQNGAALPAPERHR